MSEITYNINVINSKITTNIKAVGYQLSVGEHNATQLNFTFNSAWDGLTKEFCIQSPAGVLYGPFPFDVSNEEDQEYYFLIKQQFVDTYGYMKFILVGRTNTGRIQKTATDLIPVKESLPDTGSHTIEEIKDVVQQCQEKLVELEQVEANLNVDNKVDKVTGKGLSTNDLTNELKTSYDNAVTSSHTHSNATALTNVSGVNTGDQDLSGLVPYQGASEDVNLNNNQLLNVSRLGIGTQYPSKEFDLIGDGIFSGELTKGIERSRVIGALFTQTANKTIYNTAVENSIVGDGVGNRLFFANSLQFGRTYRLVSKGYISATNGDSATLTIKLGTHVLVTDISTFPASMTQVVFNLNFDFTVRDTGINGLIIGEGLTTICGGQGFSTSTTRQLLMTAPISIDTTIDNYLDVRYKWSSARTTNSITSTIAFIEVLH